MSEDDPLCFGLYYSRLLVPEVLDLHFEEGRQYFTALPSLFAILALSELLERRLFDSVTQ